ncbi:MAG: hypothetical protein RMJ07_04575 [Nitrososphaerota archaeon]|nr:hypothetical protein [Candidatus Bathyarchaeota archaeon]MDW8048939.1 hypothetical protein [Nitrososphaerota archaeon]
MLAQLLLWNTPPLDLVGTLIGISNHVRDKYFPELQHETMKQRLSVHFDNIALGFTSGLIFRLMDAYVFLLLPPLLFAAFLISVFLAKIGFFFPRELKILPIAKLSVLMAVSVYRVFWYLLLGLICGSTL